MVAQLPGTNTGLRPPPARAMPGQPQRAPVHRPCRWGGMERELGGSGGCCRSQPRQQLPSTARAASHGDGRVLGTG